jgi:hypothetical protein
VIFYHFYAYDFVNVKSFYGIKYQTIKEY